MFKVTVTHRDDSTKEAEVIGGFDAPDLKSVFMEIRKQIIKMEDDGKQNYWCMKGDIMVIFWDGENIRDYTTWKIKEMADEQNMNTEKFCGIKILEWEEWDDISVGILQYYNVKFLLSSMKQYDGNIVSINIDGQMIIYNDSSKIIWKGYITDIPEVMEELNNRYRKERSQITKLHIENIRGWNIPLIFVQRKEQNNE